MGARDPRDLPAFRAWFRDSKVVDQFGRPLVVYHGTGSDFFVFRGLRGSVAGYFTQKPDVASAYAECADAFDKSGARIEPFPSVMPVYLSIQNPLLLDEAWAVENIGDPEERDWCSFDDMIAVSGWEKHYDGIILRGVVDFTGKKSRRAPYDQYIAFRPEQVKSAVGNRGTYEMVNPDIRMSRPGRARQGAA